MTVNSDKWSVLYGDNTPVPPNGYHTKAMIVLVLVGILAYFFAS